ncbi:MAG: hypothetical protein RLZZ450_4915 [Pseudomonadota bacterium]
MIDQNVLLAKLAELDKRVRRVQQLRLGDAAHYASDETAAELVSFNLMVAVQCASDLAAHLIADQDWGPAASAGDAFDELAKRDVISSALAAQLRKAVGFRNAVAHGYAQLRSDLLHAAATVGVDNLVEFSRALASWVAAS